MKRSATPFALGVIISTLLSATVHGYIPEKKAHDPQVLDANLPSVALDKESGVVLIDSRPVGLNHKNSIPKKDGLDATLENWEMPRHSDGSVAVVDSLFQGLEKAPSVSVFATSENDDTLPKNTVKESPIIGKLINADALMVGDPQAKFHHGPSLLRGLKQNDMNLDDDFIKSTYKEAVHNDAGLVVKEVGMDSKIIKKEIEPYIRTWEFNQQESDRGDHSLGNSDVTAQAVADRNDSGLVHAVHPNTNAHRRLASWTNCKWTNECTGYKLGRYMCYLQGSGGDWEGDAARTSVTINGKTFNGCDEQYKYCPLGCWAMYGYFNEVPEEMCGGLWFSDLVSSGCDGNLKKYSAKVYGLKALWNSQGRRTRACMTLPAKDLVTRVSKTPNSCVYNAPWYWFGYYEVTGYFTFSHDMTCSKEVKASSTFTYNDYIQMTTVFMDSSWPIYTCPTGAYIVALTIRSGAVLDTIRSVKCSSGTEFTNIAGYWYGGEVTVNSRDNSGFCGWQLGSGSWNYWWFTKVSAASQFKLIHCSQGEISGPYGANSNSDSYSMSCPSGLRMVGIMAKTELRGYAVDSVLLPFCEPFIRAGSSIFAAILGATNQTQNATDQPQHDIPKNKSLFSTSNHEHHRTLAVWDTDSITQYAWADVVIGMFSTHILQRHYYGVGGGPTKVQTYFDQRVFTNERAVLDFLAPHVWQIIQYGWWDLGVRGSSFFDKNLGYHVYYVFEIYHGDFTYNFIIDKVTQVLITAYPKA